MPRRIENHLTRLLTSTTNQTIFTLTPLLNLTIGRGLGIFPKAGTSKGVFSDRLPILMKSYIHHKIF